MKTTLNSTHTKPMVGSATRNNQQTQTMQPEQEKTDRQKRLCDFCNESQALLYCRADTAKLCFTCDKKVHSTNQLFTKHSRSLLCDSCDSKPASVHCSTDNLVLCQNCDWDSHGGTSSSHHHDRRPIEGFTGCPCVNDLCSIFGFKDLGVKSLTRSGDEHGFNDDVDWISDLLVWETPSINSLDDLVFENDSRQDFQAMGVPTLPKNRDAACGKYKETILSQLHDILKLENNLITDHEEIGSLLGFQPLELHQKLQPAFPGTGFEHDQVPVVFPAHEETGNEWKCNYGEAALMVPVPSPISTSFAEETSSVHDISNDIAGSGQDANGNDEKQSQHSFVRETPSFLSKFAPNELISHNRDSSLSRYKEKKKTRRYDKHIRYETRKVRAETRTRIKGRFAKVVDN